VSVFLRLTEYYQGILFLTTNRVETFDEAFQSRIHMGIRYENLTAKARKKIWMHHVGKVEAMAEKEEGEERKVFSESDFEELSKRNMNGRQVRICICFSSFQTRYLGDGTNMVCADQEYRQNLAIHRTLRKSSLQHGTRQARARSRRSLRGRHARREGVSRCDEALHVSCCAAGKNDVNWTPF
jgi:hypothetical protein